MAEVKRLPIAQSEDVVRVRQAVRAMAVDVGLSLIDQTKIVTAASELARNTLDYGGGGEMIMEEVGEGLRRGIRLTFADQGPGIADIEGAMQDGFSSGAGLGLGLGGSKRLCNEFHISSEVGRGTRITVTRWRQS